MTTISMSREPFWKKFVPLFSAGMVGVAALTAASLPTLRAQLASLPNAPQIPLPALVAASVAQAAVLVGGAVALGLALAPRLGLRSWIVEKTARGTPLLGNLRAELPIAVSTGIVGSALLIAMDLALRPWMPALKESGGQTAEMLSHTKLPGVLAALLYGGITEELLMRWGLMTLFAWLGWKFVQREVGAPRPVIMWVAILISMLLFGLGHLPATAAMFPLTPIVIMRAIVLNGVGGIIFGWLYWRRSLEAAMMSHGMSHVVLTIANLALAYFSK